MSYDALRLVGGRSASASAASASAASTSLPLPPPPPLMRTPPPPLLAARRPTTHVVRAPATCLLLRYHHHHRIGRSPTAIAAAGAAAGPPPPPPPPGSSGGGGGGGAMDAVIAGMVAELRSDPALAPLLDDPKVAAAVAEVAKDPSALHRHSGDAAVMRALGRLLEKGLPNGRAAEFAAMGTTPRGALEGIAGDPELAALMARPNVREALADYRRDPLAAEARWLRDAQVQRALDLLEAALGGGEDVAGGGGVLDVK